MVTPTDMKLNDGSRIAVIGGGPAGSFFSIFLLDLARRKGVDLRIDIFEPRDFSIPGPPGCNMCGGIISESLVQHLAVEGISLSPTVVQRAIDSYVLHMDVGSVRIETPLLEKRIGAVFRGPGPRGLEELKWGSFDGHLLSMAEYKGANLIRARVENVQLDADDRPRVKARGSEPTMYDLLVVATGVNSAAHNLFKGLPLEYQPPRTTKTLIREYYLGEEIINHTLGTSMHVFLLDLPRLEFAAIIPKGDYASVCLLGEEIDSDLVNAFFDSPEVKACLPADLDLEQVACQCSPRINIDGAVHPFGDRIVFIGDSGVTRLYKDGIGAAYRTAKAAARAAIFAGISQQDFRLKYLPACKAIGRDNAIGKLIFLVTRLIQGHRFARRAVLRMTRREQLTQGGSPRMSMALWDMFTGSAPYRDILLRTLHPAFWLRLTWDLLASLLPTSTQEYSDQRQTDQPLMQSGALGKIYQPGEVLIHQGEFSQGMMVIQEGQVALMQQTGDQEVFLGVRSAGEILGETAIFEKEVNSATVRALSQVRVITVDKNNFTRRIHEDPSLAYRLFQLLSRRIRELSQQVILLDQELDRITVKDKDRSQSD